MLFILQQFEINVDLPVLNMLKNGSVRFVASAGIAILKS